MEVFRADIAGRFGVNAAVIAEYLWGEILYGNDDTHDYHRYGEDWCRASARKMNGLFPYLTIHYVKEAISILVDGGLIRKGSYNDNHFDKTNWYSFTEFGKLMMDSDEKAC